MRIYGDVLSPFVRACLVCGHEVGLSDRIELVKLGVKPVEEHAVLAKLSPIGKIPVLETDHHHPIYDSRVILEYLAHVSGHRDIIPDDGVKRFRVLTLLALATGLADAAVALRYEQAQRPAGLQWPELMQRNRLRITAAVNDIEQNWTPELHNINAATIMLATALSYVGLRHPDVNWRESANTVAAFHHQFCQRPSMQAYPLP